MQIFIPNEYVDSNLRDGISPMIEMAKRASVIQIVMTIDGKPMVFHGDFIKHMKLPTLDNKPMITPNQGINKLGGFDGK